jgi:putative molybdopterin biosynthesis protein
VPVTEAAGLITAAPVWAVRSSPPFDAAGMDGIAVRAADMVLASETTPVWLNVDAYDVADTGDLMPSGVTRRGRWAIACAERSGRRPPL